MSDNKSILFYIIVPVYKAENFIDSCISSVLSQTYQNYRLILVDDGSPDESGKICDSYAAKYPAITSLHQKNQGALAARQTALRHAMGEIEDRENTYIVYLDSDDTLRINALEKIRAAIFQNDCDMVIYGYDKVCGDKIVRAYNPSQNHEGLVQDKRTLCSVIFNDTNYNSLCRKAVRAAIISGIDLSSYYGIAHGEDLIESIDYIKNSHRVYFLNESLYNYTVNPESVTKHITDENYVLSLTDREKVHEFLLSENLFTQDDWLAYRAFCIKLLVREITRILKLRIPAGKKKKYLDDIRKTDYFRNCIQNKEYRKDRLGRKNAIFYSLFCRKQNLILILGFEIYLIAQTLKRKAAK